MIINLPHTQANKGKKIAQCATNDLQTNELQKTCQMHKNSLLQLFELGIKLFVVMRSFLVTYKE